MATDAAAPRLTHTSDPRIRWLLQKLKVCMPTLEDLSFTRCMQRTDNYSAQVLWAANPQPQPNPNPPAVQEGLAEKRPP